MKHEGIDQLHSVAHVASHRPREMLTRRERLERWAALLERRPNTEFAPFPEDYEAPFDARSRLRYQASPIEIANADPLLRAQGLAGDGLGDAIAFFGLSGDDALYVLDNARLDGQSLARRLRAIAAKRDRTMLAAGLVTAGVAAVPFLAFVFG
ncbi:hypothetical protein [Saliniramus sp.]|uniref:hypothetical protein n=1 Tax=Saliniramus sp. TaxID=2986772 RepID=UPI002C682C34|nr:hypothetical protein [Saliniramus sp.]HMB10685.1 hypothetical protein [Saliniramus sp.]